MRRIFLIGFGALALTSGCTAHVRPHPTLRIEGEVLPLKAALVIPPQLVERTDQVGQLDGVGSSFVLETGQSVPQALEEAAKKIFKSVTVVDSARKATGVDVILVPSSASLRHATNKSNDYTMRFELHAVVSKPDSGGDVLDERYSEDVTGTKDSTEAAVGKPAEGAIAAALAKLAADLHARLDAPTPVADAAVDGGSPDFSSFPAGPPSDTPGPSEPVAAAPSGAPPTPAPAATASAGPMTGLTATAPPPRSGALSGAMVGAGLVLFAAGYAAPPALLFGLNTPGDHLYSFIPLAGPLLELFTNPYLNGDTSTLVLAIAATAAQGVGLIMTIVGLATVGGGKSSSSARAESVFASDHWALVPTVTPHGGFGVSLVSR